MRTVKLFEVVLELVVNHAHPHGTGECRYRLCLPLTEHFHVDSSAWDLCPDEFNVTRYWNDGTEVNGKIVRRRPHAWYFVYANGEQEPIFQLEKERLLPGEFLDIRDHGEKMHIFRVVSVKVLEHISLAASTAPADTKSSLSADYYTVNLSLLDNDYQSFLGLNYQLTVALYSIGYVNYPEWKNNPQLWRARRIDASGEVHSGNIVATLHVWYIHFDEPTSGYELIKQMEKINFLSSPSEQQVVNIRDSVGHWHNLKIDSCEKLSLA